MPVRIGLDEAIGHRQRRLRFGRVRDRGSALRLELADSFILCTAALSSRSVAIHSLDRVAADGQGDAAVGAPGQVVV